MPTKKSTSLPLLSPLSEQDSAKGLGDLIEKYIENYFSAHEGMIPSSGLYDLVMEEVEKPLLRATLKLVQGNQKKAAALLGINRNTLRKKLIQFQLIPSSFEDSQSNHAE